MPRWWSRARFDPIELSAIVLFAGVCVWLATTRYVRTPLLYSDLTTLEEAARLRTAYGPNRYSEHAEEWIIRDFFKDRRDGFFVDVGANDYRLDSNTYYLEQHLGWSGIAIDPQATFAANYRRYRPRTTFFPLYVSDASNETARLWVLDRNPLVTSTTRTFTEQFGKDARETDAPTITLNELLDRQRVSRIDVLSIDVELAEPKVLAGFDIDRFEPALVCIEAHPQVRQQILDYFARHGYVVVGKYLRVDAYNLYFAPLL